MLLVLLIDKPHPATDLHLVRRGGGRHHLRALHPGAEVAQIALGIRQALLVRTLTLGLQFTA
ncbi:hypothetical protein D3C76_1514880 [compost metagenome]